MPGEKPKKVKKVVVDESTLKINPEHLFANGQLKTLSIAEDARLATDEDKEDMKSRVSNVRK